MKIEFPPFPNSKIDPFLVTSPKSANYNCIAWAYEDDSKWFWPDSSNIYYWPNDIPREEKIDSFIKLFNNIGYEICSNGDVEKDYQKVAIYSDKFGKPTHSARQLENGFWTSKLGQYFDVTHTIFSMGDGVYGNVAVFMRRKK